MKTTPAVAALTPPRLGAIWPGQAGKLAALMRGIHGEPDYYLIVPTHAKGTHDAIAWGGYEIDEPGATCEYDGLKNTRALVDSATEHPAAEWAAGLVIAGFNDFYLPSRRELRAIWANAPELLPQGYCWSSTQCSANLAWGQCFANGGQSAWSKDVKYRARAVRRLSVIE